jgi:excisionase family DNA binding protein
MSNPFELIEKRLAVIENLLIELKEKPEPTENRLLSVKQLSEFAGVSELTIRNWIKEGKVEAKRIGGRILIEQTQFDAGLSEVKSLKYKR